MEAIKKVKKQLKQIKKGKNRIYYFTKNKKYPYQYQAFLRRIHTIIKIDKGHLVKVEKDIVNGEQCEFVTDEQELSEIFGI